MHVWLSAWLEIVAQSQIFSTKPSMSRSLLTPQLPGTFRSSCWCLFKKSYLQLFGQWPADLNLAQVRNADNHFDTEGVPYFFSHLFDSQPHVKHSSTRSSIVAFFEMETTFLCGGGGCSLRPSLEFTPSYPNKGSPNFIKLKHSFKNRTC